MCELAEAFLTERVARDIAMGRRNQLLATIGEREQFIRRGFSFQESELASARNRFVRESEGWKPWGSKGACRYPKPTEVIVWAATDGNQHDPS